MAASSPWRTVSWVSLALLWVADLVVFYLEYGKPNKLRSPLFWASLAGIIFLGFLSLADWKLAREDAIAERRQAPRRLTEDQSKTMKAALSVMRGMIRLKDMASNRESTDFATDIEQVFKSAEWTVHRESHMLFGPPPLGLSITFVWNDATPDPAHPGQFQVPANEQSDQYVAVTNAFRNAGVESQSGFGKDSEHNGETIIMVGVKP